MYHIYLESSVEPKEPCKECHRPFEADAPIRLFLCDLNIENDSFWREVVGEGVAGSFWWKTLEEIKLMLGQLYGVALTNQDTPGWDRRLAERITAMLSGIAQMPDGIIKVEE